jgi:excisionase family DNA binding protein
MSVDLTAKSCGSLLVKTCCPVVQHITPLRPLGGPVQVRAKIQDLPATISVEDAGQLLGVSRSAAYRAAAAGHIPTFRLGRRLYVPTARLLEMLGMTSENRLPGTVPERPR